MYEPLVAADAIRLLVLESGAKGGDLKCRMFTTTHSARPSYEALSYAWGNEENLRECYINNNIITIRRNLWDALQALRCSYERILWIDAICIDQSNVFERNHQVAQMHAIYSRAEAVLIWLGRESKTSPLAMDWIEQSASRYRSSIGVLGGLIDSTPLQVLNDQITRWNALRQLCRRRYWHRVWIVQEVVLGVKIRIHCGEDEARWEGFVNLLNEYKQTLKPRASLKDVEFVRKSMAARIKEIRCNYRLEGCDLKDLLIATRDSLCTDPRDRINGLLGLVEKGGDGRVEIDYSGEYGYLDMLKTLWIYFVRDNDLRARLQGCQFVGRQFLKESVGSQEMKWILTQDSFGEDSIIPKRNEEKKYTILGSTVGKVRYTGQPWKGGIERQLWHNTLKNMVEDLGGSKVDATYREFCSTVSMVIKEGDHLRFGNNHKKIIPHRDVSAQPDARFLEYMGMESKSVAVSENIVSEEATKGFSFWANDGFCDSFMDKLSIFISSKDQMGIAAVGIVVGDEISQFRKCDVTAIFRRRNKDNTMGEQTDVTEGTLIGKAILSRRPTEVDYYRDSIKNRGVAWTGVSAKYSTLDARVALRLHRRYGRIRKKTEDHQEQHDCIRFELSGKRLRWLAGWPPLVCSKEFR